MTHLVFKIINFYRYLKMCLKMDIGHSHSMLEVRYFNFEILFQVFYILLHLHPIITINSIIQKNIHFYTPVWRQDVLCYGVVWPTGLPSVRPGSFTVFWTFFAIFAAIGLKLGYCFVVKSCCSSSHFGLIDSFLQELCLWSLAKFQISSVFRTFFRHLCSYRIETWCIAL
jgi:hypothetical protein